MKYTELEINCRGYESQTEVRILIGRHRNSTNPCCVKLNFNSYPLLRIATLNRLHHLFHIPARMYPTTMSTQGALLVNDWSDHPRTRDPCTIQDRYLAVSQFTTAVTLNH